MNEEDSEDWTKAINQTWKEELIEKQKNNTRMVC